MSKNEVWDYGWPEDELEYVHSCPVCKRAENKLLLANLVDNAFHVAAGKWNLYQCNNCKSAYLNPRPNSASIHKAYGTYYTHEMSLKEKLITGNKVFIRKLLRQLANGYYNYHHGVDRQPSLSTGAWLLFCYPKFRKLAKAKFRYLEKPKPGQKLLDVGCGNGDYLVLASEAGWEVKGVEPDPKALEVARSRGLDVVQGSIEEVTQTEDLFDVITMSHVIEHVHDPVHFVKQAYKCLKPGGILYIDTPNIESFGAKRFGRNWRGIETPRHLVLFSKNGLQKILDQASFSHTTFKSRSIVRKNIALRSYRMELGTSQHDKAVSHLPFRIYAWLFLPRNKEREEFLTVLAVK